MSRPTDSLRYGLLLLACLGGPAALAQDASSCQRAEGCAVLTPEYWSTVGVVNFNFTGLEQRGPLTDFQWGLGTTPGSLNTVPFQTIGGSSLQIDSLQFYTLYGQDVYIDGNLFFNQTVYTLNYTLPGQSLLDGTSYYVTVQITGEEPLLATSTAVKVATRIPELPSQGFIFNTRGCTIADSQRDPYELWACWDPFVDTAAPIVTYYVQAFQAGDSPYAISPTQNVYLNYTARITGLNMQVGSRYYVQVTAQNAAGVNGSLSSPALRILEGGRGLSTVGTTFVVASGIIVLAVSLYLLGFLFFRRRYNLKMAQRQQDREKTRVMKSLMYGLVNSANDGMAPADQLRNARNLAFVITDLQSSTAQSAASPSAFLKVQEIHDTVIREGIAKHGGYEINTEGDAFHIAFSTVAQAVLFGMETQYRLLDTSWPREVLRLPNCGEVRDKEGDLQFKGPRVRMGIHWAAEGTVAHRLHLLTKHRVFSGPGFQVACEVGDAANGGQVLLTHDAWMKLESNMAAAGFPTVKQIGLFKLQSWPSPVWIYEVSQLLGRTLSRAFKEPRKIRMVETGWGLNIVSPPEPREGGLLSFVAMRLDASPVLSHRLGNRRDEGSSIRSTLTTVIGGSPSAPVELNPALARQLFESLATSAMQFRGYIHLVRDAQGIFGAVFHQTVDALRFAHAAQARLLYTSWPNAGRDPHCGPVEFTPDGRLLFYGPRIAMAIHETSDFDSEKVTLPSQGQRESDVHFFGSGMDFTHALAKAAHGGQVVLSESAWASSQDQLPGSSQVVSLGTHIVDPQLGGAMLLMEVMPSVLSRRSFPPPATHEAIEPGFRDSPDPTKNMALVFTKISRPAEVIAAEQARGRISDEDIVRVLTAFNVAVGKVSRLVRELLHEYDGYECKEPEPGKFTLAFHTLEAAVRWAAVLQKDLLDVAWPEAILSWQDCEEVVITQQDGREVVLWRGLRVRIGMACGKPQYRKPLNTGRADYYGSLPNLAARVAALAHPGQILVEGSSGFAEEVKWYPEDHIAVLSLPDTLSHCHDKEEIELQLLGFYLIKDLDDAKPILQANPASLMAREYEPLAAAMRVGVPKRHRSGTSGGTLVGSFLSMSSDSQPSGTAAAGSLLGFARSGSRFFGGVVKDLPHLSGLRKKHASMPHPDKRRSSIELVDNSSESGVRRSPWGSFATTLSQRVQAASQAAEPSLPTHHSAAPALRGSPLSNDGLELGDLESGNGSLPAGLPSPILRARSLSNTSTVSAHGTDGAEEAALTSSPNSSEGLGNHIRSHSLPGRKWELNPRQVELARSANVANILPSISSSPSRLAGHVAAAQELNTGGSDLSVKGYAEEVAQTFAASRLAWPSGSHASQPPSEARPPFRRPPTPTSLSAEPSLKRISPSATEPTRESANGAFSSSELEREPVELDASTPREVAPRSAFQLGRAARPYGEGSGRGLNGTREHGDGCEEAASPHAIERSSGSDHSIGWHISSGDMVPRSSSGSSQRVSRFTARRNAVLDVTHRRQVAQEGLSEAGMTEGTPPRTWSFAGDSSSGQEFATVPEEANEQEHAP